MTRTPADLAALVATLDADERRAIMSLLAVDQPSPDPGNDAEGIHIMRLWQSQKKGDHRADNPKMPTVAHFPISESVNQALDIIRWCLAVAQLRPDSPRFAHYVSRWDVPGKIARAKHDFTFAEATRTAGPIDPAWIHLVPPALAEHAKFMALYDKSKSSQTTPFAVQLEKAIDRRRSIAIAATGNKKGA